MAGHAKGNPREEMAMLLATFGYHTTVCDGKNPGGPMGDGWQHRRLEPDDIEALFKEHPGRNPGIMLGDEHGGILCIESDTETDEKTAQAEAEFVALCDGSPPDGPSWRSRRGGPKRLFRLDAEQWEELKRAGAGEVVWVSKLCFLLGANGKACQVLVPPAITDGVKRVTIVPLTVSVPLMPGTMYAALVSAQQNHAMRESVGR